MSQQLVLRVMADFGSSGVWVDEAIGPFRHGMTEHSDLSLPASLAAAFDAWIETYWDRKQWDASTVESFNDQGRSLARQLKAFMGASSVVSYQPEAWPTGLGPEELVP
jgi:hypothetical protein